MKYLLTAILSLFFEKKYLKSKYFEGSLTGYSWAVKAIFTRNILRLNKPLSIPAHYLCNISSAANLEIHPDDIHNLQSKGTYFQNFSGKIIIGRGVYIAPNVGLITSNHTPGSLEKHSPSKNIIIGDNCWIGMNSIILPGVILASGTIIGAGSVVTKSTTDINTIIAGNPARVIKIY